VSSNFKSLLRLNNILVATTTAGFVALVTAWGVAQTEEAVSCYEDKNDRHLHVVYKGGKDDDFGIDGAWRRTEDGERCHVQGNPSETVPYKERVAPELR